MLIILILLSLVFFINNIVSPTPIFNECPKCGCMNVPYPLSTSENCGNPKYKINCNTTKFLGNDHPLEFISADGFHYKILSINPNSNSLIITPPSLIQNYNTCQSSDLFIGGFRIDENSPFNISSRNTVMLFNCSENILLSPLNCSSISPCRKYEEKVLEGRSGCRNTLCCSYLKDASMTSHRIRIRVGGCSAYTSLVDFKPGDDVNAWHYGIELQWMPPSE